MYPITLVTISTIYISCKPVLVYENLTRSFFDWLRVGQSAVPKQEFYLSEFGVAEMRSSCTRVFVMDHFLGV